MVYGHQIIITWHVNYLKVLHRDPVQIIKFALYTSSIYGEKLIVYRRKVHDYLGMDLYIFRESHSKGIYNQILK